jgi:uncharacterized cupredoxin-like copper-binding protein
MRGIVVGLSLVLLVSCTQQGQGTRTSPQPEATAGPQEVAVTAVEYEFQGVPENLEGGRVRFVLDNKGQEQHVLSIARVKTDATIEELLDLPQKRLNKHIEDVGDLFVRPGDSRRRVLDLTAGRYAYVCFVSAKDGTPHAFLGMRGEFTVA